jgi:hypothetical protein
MKTPLAVALVVVGGTLIIAPVVANYHLKANHQANVARFLEKPETRGVMLPREEVGGTYSFGCWLVGTLAIAASVYFSVRPLPPARAAESSLPPAVSP